MTEFQNTSQPDRDWWRALWPDPEAVLRELGVDGCRTLADVCCGNGHFAIPAANLVEGPVYAVDLNAELLVDLRRHVTSNGIDVTPVEGDAMELSDLLPERVERALVANTLHGVPEKGALAEAVRETLEPGGRFVVVNWHDRPPAETPVLGEPRGPPADLRMTPAETRAAVGSAGFTADESVDLPPHHYAVIFERA